MRCECNLLEAFQFLDRAHDTCADVVDVELNGFLAGDVRSILYFNGGNHPIRSFNIEAVVSKLGIAQYNQNRTTGHSGSPDNGSRNAH